MKDITSDKLAAPKIVVGLPAASRPTGDASLPLRLSSSCSLNRFWRWRPRYALRGDASWVAAQRNHSPCTY